MKKIFLGIVLTFLLIFTSCSKNKENDEVIINGEKSNIEELNNKYKSKTDNDYFYNIYVISNNDGIIKFAMESPSEYFIRVILVFSINEPRTSDVLEDYEIKTSKDAISSSDLEAGDVLICYSNHGVETDPIYMYVEDLYYLGYKTDKDIKIIIPMNS